MTALELVGIPLDREIREGDRLADIIAEHAIVQGLQWHSGDVLAVAHKVVSKAEGRVLPLDDVRPSSLALQWAKDHGKDPRVIEAALSQASRIVRMDRGILITETHHGFVCANSGVDRSNAPTNSLILLPQDPDRSALSLQRNLHKRFGVEIGCIITDTFGRPWRRGLIDVAIGASGIQPLVDLRGEADRNQRELRATVMAAADQLAAAAGLLFGKADGVPAARIRGCAEILGPGNARDLVRSAPSDLFR